MSNTTTTPAFTPAFTTLVAGGCPTCDQVGGYCGGSGHPDCGVTVSYAGASFVPHPPPEVVAE